MRKPKYDPYRIPQTLWVIGHIWERFPNLRLGELIDQAIRFESPSLPYIEDHVLLEQLQRFSDRGGQPKGGL